jgi:hypothetical protein
VFDGCQVLPLCWARGHLNVEQYNALTKVAFLPFHNQSPSPFSLQQDNMPPHVAGATLSFFCAHWVEVMDWPDQSLDLNPMENVWALLKLRLGEIHFTNLENLFETANAVYTNLGSDLFDNLIGSMSARVAMVIANCS